MLNEDNDIEIPKHASENRKITESKYAEPKLRKSLLKEINRRINESAEVGECRLSLAGLNEYGDFTKGENGRHYLILSEEVILALKTYYEKYGYEVEVCYGFDIPCTVRYVVISWENALKD
jgi:hypothetical protein